MIYTSVYNVGNDVNMLIKLASNQSFSLGNIQSIAQARWTWIVANWNSTLLESFKKIAGGDQVLEAKLKEFERLVASYNLGNKSNPFDSIANFTTLLPFLEAISLQGLQLSPEESNLRNLELDRVSRLDIEDYESMNKYLKNKMANLAQEVGLGDADASKVMGVSTKPKQRSATIEDLDDIQSLQELSFFIDGILYNQKATQKRPPDIIKLSNQLISTNSQVIFDDTFKSYVPIPFEISLEHMALVYLGDRNLWFELGAINNLQPPYVDEQGTKYSLLAPAASNNLVISDTPSPLLAVGVKIGIGSYKVKEESRIIEKVIINDNSSMILFLSGKQDASKFKPSEGAFVRVYAPGTTRTGSFILIPSKSTSAISSSIPTPTRDDLKRLDKALLQFGVDIANEESSGDFVFDPSGNFKLAMGLGNVRQTVLNALKTTQGELPFHEKYGVNANIGGQFFGTTDEALIFGTLLRDTLLSDSRFTDVKIAKVSSTGTGIALSIVVSIAGASQPIPLSFIS
jgi:hypothetical protein